MRAARPRRRPPAQRPAGWGAAPGAARQPAGAAQVADGAGRAARTCAALDQVVAPEPCVWRVQRVRRVRVSLQQHRPHAGNCLHPEAKNGCLNNAPSSRSQRRLPLCWHDSLCRHMAPPPEIAAHRWARVGAWVCPCTHGQGAPAPLSSASSRADARAAAQRAAAKALAKARAAPTAGACRARCRVRTH